MRIGIITAFEGREGSGSMDLQKAIARKGHRPVEIYVDRVGLRIGKGRVTISQTESRQRTTEIRVDAALLRSLGIVKDYEQFVHRIWSVKSFEANGAYVMNPTMPWLMASDKLATLMMLAKAGLPVPDTVSSEELFTGYGAAKEFKSSVVKPLRSGLGIGIFKLDDPDAAMHIFSYFVNLSKPLYVQRFLEKKGGGDYRVVVVDGEAIGAEFRKGATWKSNVAQGGVPAKAKLNDQLSELAVKATETMGLDFAGVDIAETRDGYYILETNPSVAWAGFKSVTGVDPAERIVEYLVRKAKA